VIFSGVEYTPAQLAAMTPQVVDQWRASEAASVGPPYLVLGVLMVVIASAIALTKYPPLRADLTPDGASSPFAVLRKPRVLYAVIAQFFYVGAQVCTWSYLISYAQEYAHLPEKTAGLLLTGNFAMFGVGRFVSAYVMGYFSPSRLMGAYALTNVGLLLFAILHPGWLGMWCVFFTSLFMSVMFPTIFALGLKGLGRNTKIGGSLLVMAIVGGAVLTPVMGLISEKTHSIALSYSVPLIAYVVILFYAFWGSQPRVVLRVFSATN